MFRSLLLRHVISNFLRLRHITGTSTKVTLNQNRHHPFGNLKSMNKPSGVHHYVPTVHALNFISPKPPFLQFATGSQQSINIIPMTEICILDI